MPGEEWGTDWDGPSSRVQEQGGGRSQHLPLTLPGSHVDCTQNTHMEMCTYSPWQGDKKFLDLNVTVVTLHL